MAKRKTDLGTLYKGSPGQWSWIAHRVTGVAIILFLFAHVVDTAVVGWGPNAYNRVVAVYHNWFVRLLELGLVAAVLYHAINGVKIMVFDFWPGSTRSSTRWPRASGWFPCCCIRSCPARPSACCAGWARRTWPSNEPRMLSHLVAS